MTERDLEGMTITELAPQIRSRKLSPVELTETLLRADWPAQSFAGRVHNGNRRLGARSSASG